MPERGKNIFQNMKIKRSLSVNGFLSKNQQEAYINKEN